VWADANPPSPQGIPQAVLVGHDWGGAVVWNMALFYPERVRWVPPVPRDRFPTLQPNPGSPWAPQIWG